MGQINIVPEAINLDRLELDPDNPRLPEGILGEKQSAILEYIARTSSIEELMEAIGENDYFPAEPVLVYRPDKSKKKYRVIEGNRRLTAVKLLNDPGLLPKRPKLAEIAGKAKHTPKAIPVIEFDKREDVLVYLGFRHVTGVKQWDPLAKARYLYQLFERFHKQHASHTASQLYREVARAIGSQSGFVRRSLDSYELYREIDRRSFFGIDGLDESSIDFSLLTTSIGYDNFREYLELEDDIALKGAKGNHNKARLENLTRWLFEKNKDSTRLGESRNIRKLNKILEDAVALKSFEKGASIDSAYRLTVGVVDDFQQHLHAAYESLMSANGLRADVKKLDADAKELIKKIGRQADALAKGIRDD